MPTEPTKTCSKCHRTLPATTEHFPRSAAHRDGLYPSCRECHRSRNKDYYRRNKKQVCQRTAAYQRDHPEMQKLAVAKWRQANRDAYLDATRTRSAAWREEHRDVDRAASRRWQREHRSAYRAIQQRARARRHGAPGDFTAEEWEALKAAFDYRCPRCGRPEPEITLTVDHVVPLALSGTNDISNIQPLCGPCNASKGAREIIDYRPAAGSLSPVLRGEG